MTISISGYRIIEPGAAYSVGVLDYAQAELDRIKGSFAKAIDPSVAGPSLIYLGSEFMMHREHLFMLLDGLHNRKRTYQEAQDRISAQLQRCRDRFSELPDIPLLENLSLGKTLTPIRQHIYDERARLLSELRKHQADYWKDSQRLVNSHAN